MTSRGIVRGIVAGLLSALLAAPAAAQVWPGKTDPDGLTWDAIKAAMPEYFGPAATGRAGKAAIPDVFGPGAVLTVGRVFMKVTNWGHCGNLFTNVSSDPSGQWPGASGIEYLSSIRLAVAGVNPLATDPTAIRRVSYLLEWRPPTLDPEDKIYRAYDGIINGQRFVNDDGDLDPLTGDPLIDEDFLDGRDNDGDGKIDEDYAAIGQEMYSCVMRDDTPEAINATFNEKHVPLGLECQQLAWAYSVPGFSDFDVIQYTIKNVSGHILDSLCIGWLVDMDCGPFDQANFYQDDLDLPGYPSGSFTVLVDSTVDGRYQSPAARSLELSPDVSPDSALCPRYQLRINGFSIADDNGDDGKTTGVPSFLLIHHTIDPTGAKGPKRVGFKAFRSATAGTPYNQGGNPIIDQQRFELMEGTEPNGINEETGFIDVPPGDQKGDYFEWCSVGPYRNVEDGESIQATVAFSVIDGTYKNSLSYYTDYQAYEGGTKTAGDLRAKYKQLDNAIAIQLAYEGIYEVKQWPIMTDGHGRETAIKLPRGTIGQPVTEDCPTRLPRTVIPNDQFYTFFDFDCDYCTGAWDRRLATPTDPNRGGLFHRTWNTEAPPPNPQLNVSINYNYTDNPDRTVAPAGDGKITLAWDNLSEVSADPKSGWFDFRGYRVWKAANWTRPVGSAGPQDDDWSLLGEFREFLYRDINGNIIPNNKYKVLNPANPAETLLVCPKVFAPQFGDSVEMCLQAGDFWDKQSGMILRADTTVHCKGYPNCETVVGVQLGTGRGGAPVPEVRTVYPIGRYKLVDKEVKDGFTYFYSVTAFDSTAENGRSTQLYGRRAAVEAEGVIPQASTRTGKSVWVVPNPYRGFTNIHDRPSAWDLTPNASDPTGTHIDFMGLPPGKWTIKIYTVSGDLVAELHSDDPVNASLRGTIVDSHGTSHPGYNRQQDTPNDGEASWNLISRNGQDIVSGIYLFTVQSGQGTQRGKFVVIR